MKLNQSGCGLMDKLIEGWKLCRGMYNFRIWRVPMEYPPQNLPSSYLLENDLLKEIC